MILADAKQSIIVLLLFCVKRLYCALLEKGSHALNINCYIKANFHIFLSKVANQFVCLFICLFINLNLLKHFHRFMLTLNTFEDAIQPLAVEMHMITCLLHAQHAFHQDNL